MLGLTLAIFAGLSHCLSSIFVRKGMYRSGESFSPIPISNFAGAVFFGSAILILGQTEQLLSFSWQGFGYLAAAGVLHFIAGRQLAYIGIRLLGANRSNPVVTSNILVAALLGILFLGEPFTMYLTLALALILGGIILIGRTGNTHREKQDINRDSIVRGLLATLGAALCWGVSPVLVKMGLQEVNSPVVATFISYTASSVIAAFLLLNQTNRQKLLRLDRNSLFPIVIAAAFNSAAHLLRYVALVFSPVSLVSPVLNSASGLLIFPLSYFINRSIEDFDLKIITGAIAVIAGVLLIFLAA